MALFGLFGRKPKAYQSTWLQLTVVYATGKEGLQPDDAFALRGKVIASRPIDFEYKPPGTFLVYFPGNAEGLTAGNQLADALRAQAQAAAVPRFGVGVLQGECLAQRRGARFAAKPVGAVISQAMALAVEEADAAPE